MPLRHCRRVAGASPTELGKARALQTCSLYSVDAGQTVGKRTIQREKAGLAFGPGQNARLLRRRPLRLRGRNLQFAKT